MPERRRHSQNWLQLLYVYGSLTQSYSYAAETCHRKQIQSSFAEHFDGDYTNGGAENSCQTKYSRRLACIDWGAVGLQYENNVWSHCVHSGKVGEKINGEHQCEWLECALSSEVFKFLHCRRWWMRTLFIQFDASWTRFRKFAVSLNLGKLFFDGLRWHPSAEPLQRFACVFGTIFRQQPQWRLRNL